MSVDDLTALIERVERLTGPCRETNRAIARAVGWYRVEPRYTRNKHGGWIAPQDWLGAMSDGSPILDSLHGTTIHRDPPAYTASVDAALTLIPEGFKWKAGYSRYVPHVAELVDYRVQMEPNFGSFIGECDSNRAIALVLAILKARAALQSLPRTGGRDDG